MRDFWLVLASRRIAHGGAQADSDAKTRDMLDAMMGKGSGDAH